MTFALDSAASEFFKDGRYVLAGEGRSLDAEGMVAYLQDLVGALPDRFDRGRAEPRTTGRAGSC